MVIQFNEMSGGKHSNAAFYNTTAAESCRTEQRAPVSFRVASSSVYPASFHETGYLGYDAYPQLCRHKYILQSH